MDINSFSSDEDIIEYLELSINKLSLLDECRLSKEEQIQSTTVDIMTHRNCVEWVIRANGLIRNIKYALKNSLEFSKKMRLPIEDSENKVMYSYYLEDAVYRDIVLWDIFRQLLNEIYKCGYLENEDISIFKFLKLKKLLIGEALSNSILQYLQSNQHQKVRTDLRNSFTHSVESTSSFIFHRVTDGKIQPDISHLFPNHPFDNINVVIDDILKLLGFFMAEISNLKMNLREKIALYDLSMSFPCGKTEDLNNLLNLYILKDEAERIIAPCKSPCEKSHMYEGNHFCKPVKIYYHRINKLTDEFSGDIDLKVTFSELEKLNAQENK